MTTTHKLYYAAIIFLTVVLGSVHHFSLFPNGSSDKSTSKNFEFFGKMKNDVPSETPSYRKVVIGAVVCRNATVSTLENKFSEQTVVLVKSVLISAKLFNISEIELHLFLEHVVEDGLYFRTRLLEMGNRGPVQLTLNVHSAVQAVPEKYRNAMLYDRRFRCAYVRWFFHTSLPNVDSIIHLDSDMIVTGNIGKHWDELHKMTETQMIGAGYNRQPGNPEFLKMDTLCFGDTPHVPPRGVNAGLLIMNLTRMREFRWEEKFIRLFDDYSKIVNLNDQKTLNILLYYNPGLLRIIPCHLHFMRSACQKGFYCQSAVEDPHGIHLIHATGFRSLEGQVFNGVYRYYQSFNLTNSEADVVKEVMEPIREYYDTSPTGTYKTANSVDGPINNCFGSLNKIMFKKFLQDRAL